VTRRRGGSNVASNSRVRNPATMDISIQEAATAGRALLRGPVRYIRQRTRDPAVATWITRDIVRLASWWSRPPMPLWKQSIGSGAG